MICETKTNNNNKRTWKEIDLREQKEEAKSFYDRYPVAAVVICLESQVLCVTSGMRQVGNSSYAKSRCLDNNTNKTAPTAAI